MKARSLFVLVILTHACACALAGCAANTPTTFPLIASAANNDPGRIQQNIGATKWQWPLENVHLTAGFIAPETQYSSGHRGIDLAAHAGDIVLAPATGIVTFVGVVVDRPVLTIDHGNEVLSSYEPVTAIVSEGEMVNAGQKVGVVAFGAHCSESCLHIGVRRSGSYVSPLLFFDRVLPAILLPLS